MELAADAGRAIEIFASLLCDQLRIVWTASCGEATNRLPLSEDG